MSDIGDAYSALRQDRTEEGRSRRMEAALGFREAAMLAGQHKMLLRHLSDSHYQLRTSQWILNLHPGNQRISRDRQKPGPRVHVFTPWTLLDVVKAAIEATKEQS